MSNNHGYCGIHCVILIVLNTSALTFLCELFLIKYKYISNVLFVIDKLLLLFNKWLIFSFVVFFYSSFFLQRTADNDFYSIKKITKLLYTFFNKKIFSSSIFMINLLFTYSQVLPFKLITLLAQFIFSCFEQHINGALTLPVVFSIVLYKDTTDVVLWWCYL